MSKQICPVRQTVLFLIQQIETGKLPDPRSRRICEQILELVEEIAEGAGTSEHLTAIDGLLEAYKAHKGTSYNRDVEQTLDQNLSKHHEIFVSHIESRNCPSHDCSKLAPSPCQMACPAGIDIPTYLSLIAKGKDAQAIEVIRRDNPLPWVCGLVCTRPCEMMCVRGRMDTPVSIKFLKAFAAERAMSDRAYVNPPKKEFNGKKVCVVGAGPGGLSAAYYLALKGYGVKVVEALPVPGGMLMVGIPRYRLPREVIDTEVSMIEKLGVEFVYNTRFGTDITLEDLKKDGYDAFFLAIGAHKSWDLSIKGEKELEGVLDAVTFLRDVALGNRHAPGEDVVIIGGGNVAIDAARTSLRLGAENVTIAYRRSRDQMPADIEEVEQAEEEGVQFAFLTIPEKIVGENNHAVGLACIKAELVKKKGSDRMAPAPIDGSNFVIKADAVIRAIGQYVDSDGLEEFEQVTWSRRGTIEVAHASMETSMPGVFAAGDAVSGPATVIEAIGGGKRAAESIDRYLNNIPQPRMPKIPVRHSIDPPVEMSAEEKMTLTRPEMQMLNVYRRRTTFQQAELGYSEQEVRSEARRCLRCDICRRCGDCVSVCRDKMKIDALQMGHLDFDHPVKSDLRKTAEKCIICGACAANCENKAMVVEEKDGKRMLKLCGTLLNSQDIQYCEACNAALPSTQYLQFIENKTGKMVKAVQEKLLCQKCQRSLNAKVNVETRPARS